MIIINPLDDFDKGIENTEGLILLYKTPLIMKNLKCLNLICWFILVYQMSLIGQVEAIRMGDTIPSKVIKRPLVAASEILGTNVLINRIDADMRNVFWAKVTPSVWKTNFEVGFQSDYDHFSTNWLGHPTHGSFFYNAARSNGFSYWQSVPFTMGGSLMWEYLGETYPPSIIDFYTTSFGGIYLGEMTHRFSELIRQKAKNKLLKHTSISVLNPVGQINSLIYNGKRSISSNGLSAENPLVRGQLSLGGSYPFGLFKNNIWGTRGYLNLTLIYGDLFDPDRKTYRPFDFFVFKAWSNFTFKGKDTIFFNISSHAPLLVKHINDNAVISLSQHYDYLSSDIYKIGSLAITGDYTYRHNCDNRNRMILSLKTGVILFGSSQSDIVNFIYRPTDDPEFQRDYVYGNGFIGEAEVVFRTQKYGKLTGNINRWLIYTDHDTKGIEDLMLIIVEYNYPVWRQFSVGLQVNYYQRLARYSEYVDFSHINNDYYEFKILGGLSF